MRIANRKSGLILWGSPKRIEPAGDYFKIREERGGYLALSEWAVNPNAHPVAWTLRVVPDNNDQSMLWKIDRLGSGFWSITNRRTGKSLEVAEPNPGVRQSGFRPGDTRQEWRFEPIKPETASPPADSEDLAQGIAQWKKGDFDSAIDSLTKAIQKQPREAKPMVTRGRVYYDKKELTKAIADFTRVLKNHGEDNQALRCRARCYYEKGDLDKALDDAKKAFRVDPDDAEALTIGG